MANYIKKFTLSVRDGYKEKLKRKTKKLYKITIIQKV